MITCPDCSSDKPFFRTVELTSYVQRGLFEALIAGLLNRPLYREVTAGYRVHCQECGGTFSIGPRGTFKHHPRALPYLPASFAPHGSEASSGATDEEASDLPYQWPLAKRKPEI
jgi:hypothetical protein